MGINIEGWAKRLNGMSDPMPEDVYRVEHTVALIRAVIADETPNIVKAMLNTPIEHTTVNLDGKTICTYPVAPDGDVPKWCLAVAAEICVTFHDNEMIARKLYAAAESELSRRIAEQTADKDRRIAELEAECERLRNARCNIFSKGNKCDCTLCKQDAEITTLRQQLADATAEVSRLKRDAEQGQAVAEVANMHGWNGCEHSKVLSVHIAEELTELAKLREEVARLSRPVESVDWESLWGIPISDADRAAANALRCSSGVPYLQRIIEPLLQSERNAREAAEKRAVAAEAERDELREACKRFFPCRNHVGVGN